MKYCGCFNNIQSIIGKGKMR